MFYRIVTLYKIVLCFTFTLPLNFQIESGVDKLNSSLKIKYLIPGLISGFSTNGINQHVSGLEKLVIILYELGL